MRPCRFGIPTARTILGVFACVWATSTAQADGISTGSVKDALSNITTAGVTVYGAIDVGYGFNSHGLPVSGSDYLGADWTIFGSKAANKAFSGLTDNALQQSNIGVKIEEEIVKDWTVIGKAETQFDPMFGEVSDVCASMVRNNGKNLAPFVASQSTNKDGHRCGQAFQDAYAGVANATYGTVTFGRQASLELAALGNYDPMNLSYAFSLLGYSGTVAAGFGDTQPGRWDNSVKYVWSYGPVHAAGMYSNGGPDTAIFSGAWGANAGFTWQGFALDAVYMREGGAVAASPLTYGVLGAAGTCNPDFYAGDPRGNVCNTNTLTGTITDNEGWSAMAKYTFEFTDCCAGLKEKPEDAPKLTLYAGFVAAQLTDPRDPVQVNQTTIGGYFLGFVNNTPFALNSARDLNTEWAGARLELPPNWAFALAWYRFAQDSFITGAGANCAAATAANIKAKATFVPGTTVISFIGNPVGANCAGEVNQVSFLVDYTFNKYFDVYAGIVYSEASGGLISGFLQDNITSVASGIRLKF